MSKDSNKLVAAVLVASTALGAYWLYKRKPKQVKEWLHPFYVSPEIQKEVKFRKGDIVVSGPFKSGTTWTLNICHQLRSGGDADFTDILVECPWIEFWESPYQTLAEKMRQLDNMPCWFPRVLKTHSPPDVEGQAGVPFLPYVKFMHNHRPEFLKEWGIPTEMFRPKSYDDTWHHVKQLKMDYCRFLRLWWPLRHEKNVLLLHYSDMCKEHDKTIRKIADFLEIKLPEDKMQKVLEYTSYKWMKQNNYKFSAQHVAHIPVLEEDAMVQDAGDTGRMSLSNSSREEISDRYLLGLPSEAMEWYHKGGDFK
eukprot:g66469.t1